MIISPGFIDIQINGAFGVDFSSPGLTDDDIGKVACGLVKVISPVFPPRSRTSCAPNYSLYVKPLSVLSFCLHVSCTFVRLSGIASLSCPVPQHGVTSFCPTIVSSSAETYRDVVPMVRGLSLRVAVCVRERASLPKGGWPLVSYFLCFFCLLVRWCLCVFSLSPQFSKYMENQKDRDGAIPAAVLGLHLEGPFICVTKKGAHDEKVIADPVDGMARCVCVCVC